MTHRFALAALCLAMLAVPLQRRFAPASVAPPPCIPAGRGSPPRHWIGCFEDPGPPRVLSGLEAFMAGVPISLDDATPEDLAVVPGLSARLAIEVVRDREDRGPFRSVGDLIRVRGIGPTRLSRIRPFVSVSH
jgi:competence protein ComEA